jgi:hypothetical protein
LIGYLEFGKWSFLGMYLLLESITIVCFSLSISPSLLSLSSQQAVILTEWKAGHDGRLPRLLGYNVVLRSHEILVLFTRDVYRHHIDAAFQTANWTCDK